MISVDPKRSGKRLQGRVGVLESKTDLQKEGAPPAKVDRPSRRLGQPEIKVEELKNGRMRE